LREAGPQQKKAREEGHNRRVEIKTFHPREYKVVKRKGRIRSKRGLDGRGRSNEQVSSELSNTTEGGEREFLAQHRGGVERGETQES